MERVGMTFQEFKRAVGKRFVGYPVRFEKVEQQEFYMRWIEYRAYLGSDCVCKGSPYSGIIRIYVHDAYEDSINAQGESVIK
jgi:hypothetical protein